MRDFLVIVDLGGDNHIPIETKADNTNEAMAKALKCCDREGYFIRGMNVIDLIPTIGIIEVK